MVQPAKGQEPSMEEILASIRRIIADDDSAKSQLAKAAEPAVPPLAVAPPRVVAAVAAVEPAADEPEPDDFQMPEQDGRDSEIEADGAAADDDREEMEAEPLVDAGFRSVEDELEVIFQKVAPPPPPAPVAFKPQAPVQPPAPEPASWPAPPAEHALMSAATTAAVDSAFNSLAQTVLVQNGRTLEDLVREMLRPLLKSWLDDNLPGLVERLVRAEIERVSRGRP